DRTQPATAVQTASNWIFFGVTAGLLMFALFLALRHRRQGRGDSSTALQLAALVFFCALIRWLLLVHHIAVLAEINRLGAVIGGAMFEAAAIWVLYMAIEPLVRRRWPQCLISWTRLWNGGARDPVVAGQILAGVALGVGIHLLYELRELLNVNYGG